MEQLQVSVIMISELKINISLSKLSKFLFDLKIAIFLFLKKSNIYFFKFFIMIMMRFYYKIEIIFFETIFEISTKLSNLIKKSGRILLLLKNYELLIKLSSYYVQGHDL